MQGIRYAVEQLYGEYPNVIGYFYNWNDANKYKEYLNKTPISEE